MPAPKPMPGVAGPPSCSASPSYLPPPPTRSPRSRPRPRRTRTWCGCSSRGRERVAGQSRNRSRVTAIRVGLGRSALPTPPRGSRPSRGPYAITSASSGRFESSTRNGLTSIVSRLCSESVEPWAWKWARSSPRYAGLDAASPSEFRNRVRCWRPTARYSVSSNPITSTSTSGSSVPTTSMPG